MSVLDKSLKSSILTPGTILPTLGFWRHDSYLPHQVWVRDIHALSTDYIVIQIFKNGRIRIRYYLESQFTPIAENYNSLSELIDSESWKKYVEPLNTHRGV